MTDVPLTLLISFVKPTFVQHVNQFLFDMEMQSSDEELLFCI